MIFIVTIFNPSSLYPLQREQVTLPMCLLWTHHRGQCPKNTCCMKIWSHWRLWPLLKLKFANGWLTSDCCGSSCKKFNSSFQFQFQFQGFQFQFHFQFHQFQFQFQNWNWNWAAIPIPELNWPQLCPYVCIAVSNEVPEHPVVSPVSGCIYDKRLIEKYLTDNGTDPLNGEKLSVDMLIDIKSKAIPGILCACAQPMEDDVTLYLRLQLAGRKHTMIPAIQWDLGSVSM